MIVKQIPLSYKEVYGIPGDIHFDRQDDAALDLLFDVFDDRGITGAILIGDTFDSGGISRHGRPARNFRFGKGTIKAEERAARPHIARLRKIVGANRLMRLLGAVKEANTITAQYTHQAGGLHVLTGNHCAWWEGVQDEYPGLMDTPWYALYGDLFDGWHVHGEETALKLGKLLVCHGHRLRGSLGKYSAASVLGNYPGQNTLYGHTHRVDSCVTPTYKDGRPVDHGAWTIGHMSDVQKELKSRFLGPCSERHKQGGALVTITTVEGQSRFAVELISIDRAPSGKPYCIVGGKQYGP